MNKIIFILILSLSNFAFAESFDIYKNVKLDPPENVDVTFQPLEFIDAKQKYLAGWKGESLSYFLSVDGEKGDRALKRHWKGFVKGLKKEADKRKVKVVEDYKNGKGMEIKLFQYSMDGDSVYQLVGLISKNNYTYYFIGTTIDGDYEYMKKSLDLVFDKLDIS